MKKDYDKTGKVLKFPAKGADKSFDSQEIDFWLDRETATNRRTRILWIVNIIGMSILVGVLIWKATGKI